jgi:hypothetical protein
MTYVPIVTPPPTQPTSPRTRELAGLLSKVLQEYTKAHPSTTKAEVRAAIRMAHMSAGPDKTKAVAAIGLALGLLVFSLLLGLFYARSAGGLDIDSVLPFGIAIVVGLLLVVLIVIKSQR